MCTKSKKPVRNIPGVFLSVLNAHVVRMFSYSGKLPEADPDYCY